jgi:hypothetical protein
MQTTASNFYIFSTVSQFLIICNNVVIIQHSGPLSLFCLGLSMVQAAIVKLDLRINEFQVDYNILVAFWRCAGF